MEPYRRRLVGLPLQRSLFREVGRAADLLGLADHLPGGRFGAWVDDAGDLFLDRSDVERLAAALPGCLAPENLLAMGRAHRAACAAVLEATDRAARSAALLDEAGARELLDELGARVAALIPYGVLSKFVPDVLWRALAAAGGGEAPPFPARSAGAELAEALLGLHRRCRALGYSPERLEADWPRVGPEAAALLHDFCRGQTGFGPLAWETPGYEDPGYVLRALRAAAGGAGPEGLHRRLSRARPPAPPDGPPDSLRGLLAFWLDFLERETWYVRRAFYAGIVPLLRRLAVEGCRRLPGFRPEHLLFLELGELTAGPARWTAGAARRQRYLADEAYLASHGVGPGRLAAILGG